MLDNPSRRIAFAIGISVLLHGLALWGPTVHLPHFKPSLPPLQAKLVALPAAFIKHRKPAIKPSPKPAVPEPATLVEALQQAEVSQQEAPPQLAASAPVGASAVEAASTPAETETLSATDEKAAERPALPKRAQLTFNIYWGLGGGLIGEVVHTLEINDGRYVLHAVTRTVGLTRLFKSFEMNQYSKGTYGRYGLRPDQYVEERQERSGTQRITAEFDHAAHLARFSNGKETTLPPDTLDFLSNMYQFPPLQGETIAPVSVSNGKKIERYNFEITPNEEIKTPMGKLLTVRLHKMHGPNEEGLDIWLAQEYRLFPVKLRFTEKNGDVTGEAVITDIRVSDEEGARSNAVN